MPASLSRSLFQSLLRSSLPRKYRRKFSALPEFGPVIQAPGGDSPRYQGFVSSAHNQQGMRVNFFQDKNSGGACCRWQPSACFESFPSLIHGGIGFALLDETFGHAVFSQSGFVGMTLKAKVQWHAPMRSAAEVFAKAVVVRRLWRFVKVRGCVLDARGKVLISGTAIFYLPSRKQLKNAVAAADMPEQTFAHCLD